MATTQEAIQGVKQLAVKFKAILDLAEHLERIDSIEQSEKEARERHDAVSKELAEKQAELANVGSEINEARSQAENILVQAQQRAEEIKAKAEADAKALKDVALGASEAALAEGQSVAARVVREAQERAQASSDAADAAEARRVAAETGIEEKAAELEELNRKLDEAKARARAILA